MPQAFVYFFLVHTGENLKREGRKPSKGFEIGSSEKITGKQNKLGNRSTVRKAHERMRFLV